MKAELKSPAYVLGRGVVSSLGVGLEATRAGLFSSKGVLPALPKGISTELKLPVFEVSGISAAGAHPGGRCIAMLKTALEEALCEAGIPRDRLRSLRTGVAVGTTVACQLNDIPFYAALRRGENVSSASLSSYIDGNPAEWIRREYGLEGPAVTVSNACASGTDAIGIAMMWLRAGIVDIAIAGGTDEINKVPYDGFAALGVCSSEPCRPFDADRAGLNLGEGAGVVVLSRRELAPSAGFAVTGFGKTADAFHITRPSPDGPQLERAVRTALSDASLRASDVGYVNAHGTGTDANDRVECAVLHRVFGDSLRFSSTKEFTGHALGAAGAIECVLSLLSLEESVIPGNGRFSRLASDMPAAPVREPVRMADLRAVMSVSLAFGGSNSAIVMERV